MAAVAASSAEHMTSGIQRFSRTGGSSGNRNASGSSDGSIMAAGYSGRRYFVNRYNGHRNTGRGGALRVLSDHEDLRKCASAALVSRVILRAEAAHSLPASELPTGPRRGGREDKGLRLACINLSGHGPRRADAGRLAGKK